MTTADDHSHDASTAAECGSPHRRHAAFGLLHRWFAFLESPWGAMQPHLDMFEERTRLTGRRGEVVFADDRRRLREWFTSIPEPTSAHHVLHAVWDDQTPSRGTLSFVVAYQSPSPSGTSGSIISYQTEIRFADGVARFAALDKTPILADTDPVYRPTWAEHRVAALIHTRLSGSGPVASIVPGLRPGDHFDVVAEVGAPCSAYVATVIRRPTPNSVETHRIRLRDDVDAVLPRFDPLTPADNEG